MDNQVNFNNWMLDWNESFDPKFVKIKPNKPKKSKRFIPQFDSNAMLDDLDKYMSVDPGADLHEDIKINVHPYNIWEFLSNEGFDRRVIKHISIEFDCVNNIVEKLIIETIEGHGAVFANIQLKD